MPSRRHYCVALAALGAGCAGVTDTTPTATPTPDPGDYPDISEAAAVTEWEEFGDLETHQTDTIPVGSNFGIAARFEALVHDGELTIQMQAEVSRGSDLVDRRSDVTDTLTEATGVAELEMVVPFSASGWEPGRYSTDVILQDETTGEVTPRQPAPFEVVEATPTPED